MKIFKSKSFIRFAKKEHIRDQKLCDAIREISMGNIDVDYGCGVIKQRIARNNNEGKSSGYRIIVYYKRDFVFVVYGFAKNKDSNITEEEKREFKKQSKIMMTLNDSQILLLLKNGFYERVMCYEKTL